MRHLSGADYQSPTVRWRQIRLGRAPQPDDWQVRVPGNMLDLHVKPSAGLSSDQDLWQRTRRATF